MPLKNESRFVLKKRMVRQVVRALDTVLKQWPRGVSRLTDADMAALRVVQAKVEVAAERKDIHGRIVPWVSMRKEEREALWRLTFEVRSVLGARAQPWSYLDWLLWTGEPEPLRERSSGLVPGGC